MSRIFSDMTLPTYISGVLAVHFSQLCCLNLVPMVCLAASPRYSNVFGP